MFFRRSILFIFCFCDSKAQIFANFLRISVIYRVSVAKNTPCLANFAHFHEHNAQIVPGRDELWVFFDRCFE